MLFNTTRAQVCSYTLVFITPHIQSLYTYYIIFILYLKYYIYIVLLMQVCSYTLVFITPLLCNRDADEGVAAPL